MKLKIVGTGAITGKNRSACSLIDNKILVDCGNGLLKTLEEQGCNIYDIETILITHLHADHFFDIPFLVLLNSFNKSEKTTKIYCPIGTEKIIEHLCNDYIGDVPNCFDTWKENGKIEFIEFDNLKNKEVIKGYYVTSYLVEHGNRKPAYGYVIKHNDKSIGFSGDSAYCENIDEIVNNSNVAVLDMIFPKGTKTHMGFDNIENIIIKYGKKIIATHMSDDSKEYAKNKNIEKLIVPNDGDEFEV